MSVHWSTIASLIGLAAAIYSTLDMLLSKDAKAAIRDRYETFYLHVLIYFTSRKSKGRNRPKDSPSAVDDALRHLELQERRLESELLEVRASRAAALAALQGLNTTAPYPSGSDSNR
jgi:hypothetical protein